MNRRILLSGFLAALVVGLPTEAAARRSRKYRSSRRNRGLSGASSTRGTTDDGECPCNGGKVCVGPRGGRYCITSSGRKRYGV
jgi:hypothetical protein